MEPISSKIQIEAVCQLGKGVDTCSFLIDNGDKFSCAKDEDITSIGQLLESVYLSILQRQRNKEMTALGDNCKGWKALNK